MYQGCNSRGVFSKLSNFPHCGTWKVGKLESLESLENIPNFPNFPNFFRGLKRPLVYSIMQYYITIVITCIETRSERTLM